MNDEAIPASLKWGKTCYDDELIIVPGSSSSSAARDLKLRVQSLTGVPPSRQKLLCPKAWKGALKDDDDIIIPGGIIRVPTKEGKRSRRIVVTLVGSAESLDEKPPEERPRFEEDMTPEELWRATRRTGADEPAADGDDDDAVVVDIVALQKEPGMERDDGKMEMYQYDRLVTGLPQHQINDMLAGRNKKKEEPSADYRNNESSETTMSSPPPPLLLLGEVAMTMGAELRRSYVNSLAVLRDGTLVSGLEDGHVQLWRRGRMVKDARHPGSAVDRVLAFPSSSSASSSDDDDDDDGPSFATAGDGGLCLWTKGGDHLLRLGSYPGTTPASIAAGAVVVDGGDGDGGTQYLAACFRVTRQVDPNRFRLLPQNEAERRRRVVAEAEERTIQNQLLRVSGCIRIWFYNSHSRGGAQRGGGGGPPGAAVREVVVPPEETMGTTAAPITELLDVDGRLACGDAWGCIRTLELAETTGGSRSNNNGVPSVSRRHLLQFRGYGIACMERVDTNVLAVSIEANRHAGGGVLASAVPLNATTRPHGIYIVDLDGATVRAVLDAHSDTVRSMCPLPDGSIMSAGGKMDATVRVWDDPLASTTNKNSVSNDDEEAKIVTEARVMKEPGYVFDLKVLPDSRGSNAYAIAAARYNVVKIVI